MDGDKEDDPKMGDHIESLDSMVRMRSERLDAAEAPQSMDQMLDLDIPSIQKYDSLELNLESRLNVEVSGPRWHQDNVMLYSGYYLFTIKSFRSGGPNSEMNFLTDRQIVEV